MKQLTADQLVRQIKLLNASADSRATIALLKLRYLHTQNGSKPAKEKAA